MLPQPISVNFGLSTNFYQQNLGKKLKARMSYWDT